jgi:hypothetical protein
MNDRLSWAIVVVAVGLLGVVGGLLVWPWLFKRPWSESRRSMQDRHDGS